mmetsp:Transcript_25156/g.63817  ORF Transcript_25156/g.63817 Transcript_25156/m.63817 type:complete len:489 (-) Transcript_25156:48-1514(-)
MAENAQALAAAFVASLGAFLFGLDIGYIAPILDCASFKRDVAHAPDWADSTSKVDSSIEGFMVGIFSIGCVLASLPVVSGHFLDHWGRRASIIVGSLVFLVGCVFQATAMSIRAMLTGRFVSGFAIGLLSTVVPLYQAEMAPASLRGTFTTLYQLMITSGILVAAAVDLLLVERDGGWRVAIWLQALPAVVILAAMPLLPRSPRWLVQQGRRAEALEVLQRLRSEEKGKAEYDEIVAECEASKKSGEAPWSQLVTGRIGRLVALGSLLQLLQNLVGINTFMYFGPRIFASFGLNANLFQTINNGVNLVATVPALYLVDRAGRRSLLIFGAVGMACSCVVMGTIGVFCVYRNPDGTLETPPVGVSAILSATVFFFVMNFACTWGPVAWIYCAEMFPLEHRSRCVGITTTANWVGNYLIAQFTPVLLDRIGFGTFYVLACCSLVGLLLALRLPETKGLMLEHIAQRFDDILGPNYGTLEHVDGKPPKALA